MRTKLFPMILGAALMLVLAAALACGGDDKAAPTPDTAAIQAAVKAGLEESLPAPAPSPVSAAEIQQMVKGAISEIPAPDVPEQLSSAELQRLVEAAVASSAAAAAQPLSASAIQSMVSAAVKASTSGAASKAEIEALIVKATDEAAAAAAEATAAAAEAAAAAAETAAAAIASVPTVAAAAAAAAAGGDVYPWYSPADQHHGPSRGWTGQQPECKGRTACDPHPVHSRRRGGTAPIRLMGHFAGPEDLGLQDPAGDKVAQWPRHGRGGQPVQHPTDD